jgi:hypothetical protein
MSLRSISDFPEFIGSTLFTQIYKIDQILFDLSDRLNSIMFGPVTIAGPLFVSSTTNCDCTGTTGSLIVAGGVSIDADICVGGRVLSGPGSALTPSISFCGAQGSGFYNTQTGNGFNLACNTTDIAQFSCSPANVNFISSINILDPALTQSDCNGHGSLRTNGGIFCGKNLSVNEQIFVADGIASAPSYSFCNNVTTGIYSNSGLPNQLSLSAGGVDTVDVTPNAVTINGNATLTQALTVLSTNVATCTPMQSGAIVVAGGVSVGGNLCVDGPINLSGIVTITNTTGWSWNGDGALIVKGGFSLLNNICLSTINNSRIFNANGSATAPSYTFCNFSGNGMFSTNATTTSLASNSVDVMDLVQGTSSLTLATPYNNTVNVTGNVAIQPAGNGLQIKVGTNARMGTATLGAGGTVTIDNNTLTLNTNIFAFTQVPIGTIGSLHTSAIVINFPTSSFTISSTSTTDLSVFSWMLVESF